MNLYYDRQGHPITLKTFGKLIEDLDYRRILETTLPDGKWVSTVWLGINHQFGQGPPLIFETMVFESRDNLSDIACQRYSTEDDAIIGHQEMVAQYQLSEP